MDRKAVDVVLPSDGSVVKVRELLVGQMNKLASPKRRKNGDEFFFKEIVPECAGLSLENYEKLLTGDETAILVGLYRATFGDSAEFVLTCPACNARNSFATDSLDQAALKRLPSGAPTEGLKFSYRGHEIVYHLLRSKERLQTAKEIVERSKFAGGEESIQFSAQLAAHIDSVSGVTDQPSPTPLGPNFKRAQILVWVESAGLGFLEEFQREIESRSCGIDLECVTECQECQEEIREEAPILECFFSRGRHRKGPKTMVRWATRSEVSAPSIL